MTINCPACGRSALVELDHAPFVLACRCSKCETCFTTTLNRGVEEVRRSYELAEDTDDGMLVM